MVSRRFSLWQKVVALAPLLMLAVYLPGELMLRCRISGELRPACCCSHDGDGESAAPATASIKAQDCCDQEIAQSVRPVVDADHSPQDELAPIVSVALLAPVASPATTTAGPIPTWAAQRHGPAREGPPLVLLKHAFLI
jgi:hypothetical protein